MAEHEHVGDCLTLDRAYQYFNERLFDSALPPALITFQRKSNTRGYFATDRFNHRVNNETVHELAMNPDTFTGRSDKEILSTLVHEMAHCWQATHGTPSRRGYHNREWADRMQAIGLMPTDTGIRGGKTTGQQMTHYIMPSGRFDQLADELLTSGFQLNWQSQTFTQAGTARPRNKIKYTCPVCGQNAWAKPDANLICGDCMQQMEPKQ